MKKSKIICLVVCMLMIVTVFPVVGLPTQTGETKNISVTQPRNQPPGPGYAPMPSLDTLPNVPKREHPEKTAVTMDDIVMGSLPFVILLMVGLAIVMVFPILATWLPGRMGV